MFLYFSSMKNPLQRAVLVSAFLSALKIKYSQLGLPGGKASKQAFCGS
jgi:hypothetical protein